MSESNDGSTTDRLRDALGRTADEFTLDTAAPASVMQRASTRRRRRRIVLVGAGAAVGVAVIGAAVANRNLGDDTIELATPETTEPVEASSDDVADTTLEPTTPPTTVPITTPPTLPIATSSPVIAATATAAPEEGPSQVLPWRDGFLSIGFSFPPQPLTPLTEEMAALFPDEITALFPDGLPPTIDEAVDVLNEAGLLDEVSRIVSEHPELSEAIYGTAPPPPTATAAYTVDGIEWTVSELELPTGFAWQFAVADDRLITWSTDPRGPFESGSPASAERQLVIAATSDLTTWETTTVELTAGSDADAGDDGDVDAIHSEVFVDSLAVSGDRWLAHVSRHTWVDYEAMLPDDVRNELWASETGYSLNPTPAGIEIEVFADDGSPALAESFTWDELGLDSDPEPSLTGPGTSTMLTGTFNGDHEELPAPDGRGFGGLATLGDEFVLLGDTVQTSIDGRTWEPLGGLPDNGFWHSVTSVSGGHLFVGDGRDGAIAWLRLDDGTLTEATLPELPDRYGLWNDSGSAAWITEIGTPPGAVWEPLEVTLEHDGFTLDLVDGPEGSTYTLTDSATGETILTGDSGDGFEPEIWEFDEALGQAWVVIRDDAGTEIVRIPGEIADEAYQAAFEANGGNRTVVGSGELDEWRPDFWLIATADGINWLTVDLDDPGPESEFWPNSAAVNEGSVLYLTDGGWALQQLSG